MLDPKAIELTFKAKEIKHKIDMMEEMHLEANKEEYEKILSKMKKSRMSMLESLEFFGDAEGRKGAIKGVLQMHKDKLKSQENNFYNHKARSNSKSATG